MTVAIVVVLVVSWSWSVSRSGRRRSRRRSSRRRRSTEKAELAAIETFFSPQARSDGSLAPALLPRMSVVGSVSLQRQVEKMQRKGEKLRCMLVTRDCLCFSNTVSNARL